jgi:hypothetical protein
MSEYSFEPDETWSEAAPQEIPPFTYWPITVATGLTLFDWGIITLFPIFILGIIIFVIGLIGWIYELREVFYEENNNKNGLINES